MSVTARLAGALLLTSALVSPSLALAQSSEEPADTLSAGTTAPAGEEPVDISVPGGDIVVTGRRSANPTRASGQVISVLSSEEIARTGEGDIAGALGRVTGLSVVGSGYVYVRGLGDRYSLALLNGSPLPSPEPLKRVIPLDLFPSSVISSSLVQKSYSVNFPGEFGGGVINLTTKVAPRDGFLSIGGGLSGDTETIGQFGYSYYGSKSDWTGFDNGQRDLAPALKAFIASGDRLSSGTVNTPVIAGQLVTARNAVVQRVPNLPPNTSLSLSAGKSFDVGSMVLGVIAAAGYSNKWQNRDARQQTSLSADLSTVETDFHRISTDQRIVVNGLLGFGLEFGEHQIRWTNLYIRDTIKQARYAIGQRGQTTTDLLQQDTAWYERQLIDTQIVGEFKPMPGLSVDIRAAFANSQREAPYELNFEYIRTNAPSDPFGHMFINRLQNGNAGDATISFSDLNEDLWSGGVDVSYELMPTIVATVGGAFSDTIRTSSRREFKFLAPSNFPAAVGVLRPDLLMAPEIVNHYNIGMIETDEANPAFRAKLRNWAGYAKVNAQLTDALSLDAGVRFEKARQSVNPVQVFHDPASSLAGTRLNNEYWLPAATLTWEFRPDMQLRVSGSKTIARPQFRELIYQPYFDPESNRQYVGNPLLIDSELYNGEARLEWYIAPEQRVSVAGFYKKIDRPIEAFVTQISGAQITSYANAPEAQLYGAELEAQKYFDLSGMGGWMSARRAVAIANYTYTKSKLKVSESDTVPVFAAFSAIATDYFRDGSPLTGQSDHIVNLQLGLENVDRLSQQTFLLSYASKRVVSRGLTGTPPQPDVIEKPGFQLDFVAREAADFLGQQIELKFEVRNILGTRHKEYQASGGNQIDVNTYDVGRSFAASATLNF